MSQKRAEGLGSGAGRWTRFGSLPTFIGISDGFFDLDFCLGIKSVESSNRDPDCPCVRVYLVDMLGYSM